MTGYQTDSWCLLGSFHFSLYISSSCVGMMSYQCLYNIKPDFFLFLFFFLSSLKHSFGLWVSRWEQCFKGDALKEMWQTGRLSRDLAASHHKGISFLATSCSVAVILKLTADSACSVGYYKASHLVIRMLLFLQCVLQWLVLYTWASLISFPCILFCIEIQMSYQCEQQ